MPVTPLPISEESSAPETWMLQSPTGRNQLQTRPGFIHLSTRRAMIAYSNFRQLTPLKENYSVAHCHSKGPNTESYQEASCAGLWQIMLITVKKPKTVVKCCLKWSEEVDSPSVCSPKQPERVVLSNQKKNTLQSQLNPKSGAAFINWRKPSNLLAMDKLYYAISLCSGDGSIGNLSL